MKNIEKPTIHVFHSDLKRFGDSGYKSVCPVCDNGVLLIFRDPKTYQLMRQDCCVSCGQRVVYQDDEINTEKFKAEIVN